MEVNMASPSSKQGMAFSLVFSEVEVERKMASAPVTSSVRFLPGVIRGYTWSISIMSFVWSVWQWTACGRS